MGLGITSNVTDGVRAAGAPQNGARGPTQARAPATIPDNDAAVAVIQNSHRAETPDIRQNTIDSSTVSTLAKSIKEFNTSFTENLSRYKDLCEKIAAGRFSPKNLREQAKPTENTTGMPGSGFGADLQGRDSALGLSRSELSTPFGMSIRDMRGLAWLRDKARRALLSHEAIEPGKVLLLLRDMIRTSAAARDKDQT